MTLVAFLICSTVTLYKSNFTIRIMVGSKIILNIFIVQSHLKASKTACIFREKT